MVLATDLPGRLDFYWYPRNEHTVVMTWPSSIVGRTFEVRIAGDDDPVDVDVETDTLRFTIPAIDVDAHTDRWSLVETTGDEVTLVGGKVIWSLSYDDSADPTEVTVAVGDINVTVAAGTALPFIDGGNP